MKDLTPERTLQRSRDMKRFVAISVLNSIVMVFAGVRGAASIDGALLSEMAHDMGDAGVNTARAIEYKRQNTRNNIENFRRATYVIVSTIGALTALKSGVDLVSIAQSADGLNDVAANLNRVVDGTVIAGVNQASYVVSQRLEDPESSLVTDAQHHSRIDRNASLGLAGCLTVGALIPGVAEAGGVAMGMYTAWHMRPTTFNLHDHHHKH
jgi:hypothetical protein